MFAQNKDCRLQQARMWSEWKELRARETLASHAVLLRAHAAHPPLQPQPQPRRSSSVATAFLSSCVASTAFRRNALHKSTPAAHQWLPPSVSLTSLPAVRDAHNKPCTDCFFVIFRCQLAFFLSSSALNTRVLSVILPVLDSLKRPWSRTSSKVKAFRWCL